MRFGKGVFFLAPCLLTVILCISTFEALVGGHHPRDAKKVQVTGAGGRLRERRNTLIAAEGRFDERGETSAARRLRLYGS